MAMTRGNEGVRPLVDPEVRALAEALGAQRRHILGILDGLTEAQLRRPVLPSGWTCLGLVRHLALDDERFWFRAVLAAHPDALAWLDSPAAQGTWQAPESESPADVLQLYRDESARSDAVMAGLVADEAPKYWPPELFGDWRLDSVREVLLHVLAETATHAGHLDAARELIDGKQWMVLDD